MKISFIAVLSFMFFALAAMAQEKTFVVTANKGYAEPYTDSRREVGVRIPVGYPETKGSVSHWSNKDRKVVCGISTKSEEIISCSLRSR